MDESLANEENYDLLAGQQVEVNEGIDDDAVHLMVHISFVKMLLTGGKKMDVPKFLPHIAAHRQSLAKVDRRRAESMPQPPGGNEPPGKGKGGHKGAAAGVGAGATVERNRVGRWCRGERRSRPNTGRSRRRTSKEAIHVWTCVRNETTLIVYRRSKHGVEC